LKDRLNVSDLLTRFSADPEPEIARAATDALQLTEPRR